MQLRVHAPPQHQQTEWECAVELFQDLRMYLVDTGWQVCPFAIHRSAVHARSDGPGRRQAGKAARTVRNHVSLPSGCL